MLQTHRPPERSTVCVLPVSLQTVCQVSEPSTFLGLTFYAKPALQMKRPAHKPKSGPGLPSWWMCNDLAFDSSIVTCRATITSLQQTAIITIAFMQYKHTLSHDHFDIHTCCSQMIPLYNEKNPSVFCQAAITVALYALIYLFVCQFESHLLSNYLEA